MNFVHEKSKLTVLAVAFLLVAGSFALLPVGAATVPSSATHATPAATGVTETLDYPIIVASSGASYIRTITVTNPLGNLGIQSVTLVIPSGAASSVTDSNGGFGTGLGCNEGQYHSASIQCADQVIGSGNGPYTITWQLNSGALVPGGASVQLSWTMQNTSSITSSSSAYTYSLASSYTPVGSSPVPVVMPSMTLFETLAPTLGFTGYPSSSPKAGTTFSVSATSSITGLPLAVTGSVVTNNAGPVLTISPGSNGTYVSSASQPLTVNETGSGNLQLSIAGNGSPSSYDGTPGGLITASTSSVIAISAGSLSQVSVLVNQGGVNYTSASIVNITTGAPVPILGAAIYGELTDAFGNPIAGSSQTITFTATTVTGSGAGFTFSSAFTGSPYTVASGLNTQVSCVTASASGECSLSGAFAPATGIGSNGSQINFAFGVNYGDVSNMHASSGSFSGISPNIHTYTFDNAAPSVSLQGASNPITVGKTVTLVAKLTDTQANVPVYFGNSTDTSGLFSNGQLAIATKTNGSGYAVVTWSVGSTVVAAPGEGFNVNITIASSAGVLSNTTTATAGVITTQAGSLSKLVVTAFFQGAGNSGGSVAYQSASGTYTYYYTAATATPTTSTVSSGLLILDILATDQFGNPVTVNTNTQVSVSVSSGTLSSSTGWIYASNLDTANDAGGNPQVFGWTAPSSGSSATITATGIGLTGSDVITIVSPTPLLTVPNPPTTVTNGNPTVFTGTVNASTGYIGNAISSVQFSSTVDGSNGPTGSASLTCDAANANCSFTFSVLLSATGSNIVNITVYDNQSPQDTFSQIFLVPQVSPSQTFNASMVSSIQFANGPKAVNATYTNNGASTFTVIVVANVLNSQGAIILESTGTITVAAGATGSAYPIIQGIPSGTYTVQVTVYSLAYVTLSQTTSITVTV